MTVRGAKGQIRYDPVYYVHFKCNWGMSECRASWRQDVRNRIGSC